jgi:Rrf2 family protein
MPLIHRDTDYAVRVLVRLAVEKGVRSVPELAQAEDAPVEFLRKIMQRLQHAGLVRSRRGPFGGYELARNPSGVTLLQVVQAVQGDVLVNQCLGWGGPCPREGTCPLRPRLEEIQQELTGRLSEITLAQIAADAVGAAGNNP